MPILNLGRHLLPHQRRCAQPSLRDERHCRFHIIQNVEAEVAARMSEMTLELEVMELPEPLETLRRRLDKIRSTLLTYAGARLTLTVAIDRLSQRNPAESRIGLQVQSNQSPDVKSMAIKELMEILMESMNYASQSYGKVNGMNDVSQGSPQQFFTKAPSRLQDKHQDLRA